MRSQITNKLILLTLLALLFLVLPLSVSAQFVISTEYGDGWQKICYDDGTCSYSNVGTYLRWDNVWMPISGININNGNWTYRIDQDSSNFILTRLDDTLRLPKSLGNYHFSLNKISFDFTVTPVQLAARSTQVGANWYIEIPEALVKTRFLWDDKKPEISNNTGSILNDTDYWYVRYGGKYYLAYNQSSRTWGASSSMITFRFNSWTVGEGGNAWSGNSAYSNFALDRNTNHIILPSVVTDGLVLYQKMSGSSGITSYDMNTTSNNNGTLTNMNTGLDNGTSGWNSSGKFGNAVSFDGTNDYINAGNGASLTNISSFTYEAWIYRTGTSNYPGIFGRTTVGKADMRFDGAGAYLFIFVNGTQLGIGNINLNTWYHVVGTWDGTYIKGFLNGNYVGNNTAIAPSFANEYLFIGQRNTGSDYFNGLIDEVRIYNRALSQEEINQTMINTMSTSANLTTWYDAGTGNETYQVTINATTPTNSNYTVNAYDNDTSALLQTWTAQTGNQTLTFTGTKAQDTKLNITLNGNGTATPEIITATFWTQETPLTIISWGNDYTNNGSLSFSAPKNTNITYNVTANHIITTWSWSGATKINGSGSTNSYAYTNFSDAGIHTITVYGENVYGITDIITWTVNVEKSTNLNLSGYVTNTLELPLQNARVDFNGSYVFTDAAGYYNFSGIDEDTYTTLVRAIGYRNDTEIIDVSGNVQQNFTLSERRPVAVSAPGFGAISGLFILAVTIIFIRIRTK